MNDHASKSLIEVENGYARQRTHFWEEKELFQLVSILFYSPERSCGMLTTWNSMTKLKMPKMM